MHFITELGWYFVSLLLASSKGVLESFKYVPFYMSRSSKLRHMAVFGFADARL